MLKKLLKNNKGFTLIELMIVMTVIGILASIAVPNYRVAIIKAKEASLKEALYTFSTVIDHYYADNLKYPDSLDELKTKKYLREIPIDPFTKKNDTWVTVPPEASADGGEVKGSVYEVHSGSNLIGLDGRPYNEWRYGDPP